MQDIRRENIKYLLTEYKSMSISALAKHFDVSEMTIHRDLDVMQSRGIVEKKRGGAVITDAALMGNNRYVYSQVQNLYVAEKQAIAKQAVKLIGDRETVVFDNSTTAFEAAKLLAGRAGLSVIATNPGVFNALMYEKDISLYSTGGLYSSQTNSFVGSTAEDFISKQSITTCIVSAGGLSIDVGATDPFPAEASLKRKIVQTAQRTLLLIDHHKFGRVSTEKIADIEVFDYVITDDAADADYINELERRTKVIVCEKDDQ